MLIKSSSDTEKLIKPQSILQCSISSAMLIKSSSDTEKLIITFQKVFLSIQHVFLYKKKEIM